ncbi:hypothetical protein [Mycolicibacterium sp. XJ870]
MSRRFAGVGVAITAARLREIAAGAPASDAELTNVEFGVMACELMHDKHLAKIERGKRSCTMCLVVVGMSLVMFSSLLCIFWLLLILMMQTPY